MKVLDLQIYLLIVLRQQGHEKIDYDPRGQSIVCRCAVDLLTLPLDPAHFFVKRLRPIPESIMIYQLNLGWCSPRDGTILIFILGLTWVILLASVPFLG
jgi:hypothetical protein